MDRFTMSDLGIFVTTIAGAIVLILGALQKSKCKTIDCCCMKCDRDPSLKTESTGLTPRLPPKGTPTPTNP